MNISVHHGHHEDQWDELIIRLMLPYPADAQVVSNSFIRCARLSYINIIGFIVNLIKFICKNIVKAKSILIK